MLKRAFGQMLIFTLVCLVALAWGAVAVASTGKMRAKPPEVRQVIMIGDRLVDVAHELGVLPVAMSVRGSLWPKAKQLKTASQILGCPNYVTKKNKEAVPEALKRYPDVQRLLVEKSENFCLYRPAVKPTDIAAIVGDTVAVEYVDFTQGVGPAILEVGKVLGLEEKAEKLAGKYREATDRLEALKKKVGKLGLNVVVINGVLSKAGKKFLRVETPGGYSDRFMLEPLGCKNVGDGLTAGKKPEKGHVTIRSLRKLLEIKPDALVITGDAAAVQMALHQAVVETPELAELPLITQQAVYALPAYYDSGVLEYPEIFTVWATVLSAQAGTGN